MPFFYENHKDAYGTTDTRVGRTQRAGKKKIRKIDVLYKRSLDALNANGFP